MRGDVGAQWPDELVRHEIALDYRITPDEVDDLPMSVIESWVAYRQASTRHRVERIRNVYHPPGDPADRMAKKEREDYEAAVLIRDRQKRDVDKWVGIDERMAETCRKALEVSEKKVKELVPKPDGFAVAIGLLQLIAEDGGR